MRDVESVDPGHFVRAKFFFSFPRQPRLHSFAFSHIRTLAPSPKNSSAQARPMPRVPPVTRMRWKSGRHLDCVGGDSGSIGYYEEDADFLVAAIYSSRSLFLLISYFDGRPRPRFDSILTIHRTALA